jgi:hypothetical protein
MLLFGSSNKPQFPLGTHLITPTGVGTGMAPENKPNPTNPPAPVLGAGVNQEGERQGQVLPLPRYVITPQELRLKEWLQTAKSGDRLDISLLAPPPPVPQGAVRIDEHTKFFNFRIRFVKEKNTLVIKSGGFTLTVNPLRGIRVYSRDKKIAKEYNDCWATLLFSTANEILTKHGYDTFSSKWFTASLPDSRDVKRLIALVSSLIFGRINELKDPMFRKCLNPDNPSKTP